MQGENRPHTTVVWLTMNTKVLEELDALVPPRGRSKVIEGWAREYVLKKRHGGELPEAVQTVLDMID